MSIRFWGNQHGRGCIFEGEDATKLRHLAALMGTTPQRAFEQALTEYVEKKENVPRRGRTSPEGDA
jgi:hypothetical protein